MNTYLNLRVMARLLEHDQRTIRHLAQRGILTCDWLITGSYADGGKKGAKPIFDIRSVELVRRQVERFFSETKAESKLGVDKSN